MVDRVRREAPNATLQVTRDNHTLTLMVRDTDTGRLLVTVDADWMAIGDSISKGGLGSVPANCTVRMHAVRAAAPTNTERTSHLIQSPELPDQKLYPEEHQAAVAAVLRSWEVNGWKAVPGQLGNKDRIKRTLPNGGHMYEVEFVRHTFQDDAQQSMGPAKEDTPVQAAMRRAFDSPTIENLEQLVAAAMSVPKPEPTPEPAAQ